MDRASACLGWESSARALMMASSVEGAAWARKRAPRLLANDASDRPPPPPLRVARAPQPLLRIARACLPPGGRRRRRARAPRRREGVLGALREREGGGERGRRQRARRRRWRRRGGGSPLTLRPAPPAGRRNRGQQAFLFPRRPRAAVRSSVVSPRRQRAAVRSSVAEAVSPRRPRAAVRSSVFEASFPPRRPRAAAPPAAVCSSGFLARVARAATAHSLVPSTPRAS